MRLRTGTKVSLVSKDKMLPVFETEVTEVNPDTRVIVFRDVPPSYFSPGDSIVRTADQGFQVQWSEFNDMAERALAKVEESNA